MTIGGFINIQSSSGYLDDFQSAMLESMFCTQPINLHILALISMGKQTCKFDDDKLKL